MLLKTPTLALALLAAPAALAHIQLDAPLVRYSNENGEINKACPCGAGNGGGSCQGLSTSDPNRDESRVTELAPGASITVRWHETIGHVGRHRIAFDDDGADLADFNANILTDVTDPSDGSGERSADITLPSTPCERCTLQLIQVMNGNTADPVLDPTGFDTYFQCADLTLRAGAPTELPDPSPAGCASAGGSSTAATAGALLSLLVLAGARRRGGTRDANSRP